MKNLTLLICTLFVFTLFSCEEEEETIVQDTSNNFTKTAPIASLISRVAQYETTADNVLDGTSYCSIKLPVHVTVNGRYVYVASPADYETVQDIKDYSNSDDDKVHFTFPVTMIYPNSYEHTVNETEFNAIMASYGDDSAFHDIDCIDFDYSSALKINLYNTNNQVASTVTVTNDVQLYNFIQNLNDAQVVSLVFPINVINSNSQTIAINNKAELEDAINSAVTTCSTVPNPTSLFDVLRVGTWRISYAFHGTDCTNQYSGYNFTFESDRECHAVKNSTYIDGDWDVHSNSRLDLHFDGNVLQNLETNWDVLEYTGTYVRLRVEVGGSGPNEYSYLSFTKN